jgi:hypothetical protein
MIVLPIAADQMGAGYRVELKGLGISLRNSPTEAKFIDIITKLRPSPGKVNDYQDSLHRL